MVGQINLGGIGYDLELTQSVENHRTGSVRGDLHRLCAAHREGLAKGTKGENAMAGFVEVMRIARRMCNQMDECEVCPLYDGFSECCLLSDGAICHMDSDFARYEADIMKWAIENTENRYPTWREWQKENFPDTDSPMCPCSFIGTANANCAVQSSCAKCSNQTIPAAIAKKLGIQPIPVEPKETLVDEYERLRNRAENLNLYLNKLHDAVPVTFESVQKQMSGMPGYTRE